MHSNIVDELIMFKCSTEYFPRKFLKLSEDRTTITAIQTKRIDMLINYVMVPL